MNLSEPSAISNEFVAKWALRILLLCLFVSIFGALWFQSLIPFAILPALILVYMVFLNVRWIYYLMFLLIPLSTEVEVPGGFGLDFPDELLMLGLTFFFIFWAAQRFFQWDIAPLLHPISLFLLAHYSWTFITALQADNLIISIKFFLAKTWYLVVFYLLTFYLLPTRKEYRTVFQCFFWTLILTFIIVIFRHGYEEGFSFAGVNYVVGPFYRNHVTYGAIGAVFAPFIYYLIKTESKGSRMYYWYWFGMLIVIIGVITSFTRAAIGALFLAVAFAFILRIKLVRWSVAAALFVSILFIGNILRNNNYLNLAPKYEKTITHTSFDDLLDATYKLQDISTMERVYRWVAGFHMVGEKPFMGFGPGNFYNSYKSYTINKFRTYVSDNPEQSGVHNYFLMIVVEQGIPGLVIFLILVGAVFIYAEKVYHFAVEEHDKLLILCAVMAFFVIMVLQLMNDLIETDKIGPFFFLAMTLIVRVHRKYLPFRNKSAAQLKS